VKENSAKKQGKDFINTMRTVTLLLKSDYLKIVEGKE